MGCRCQRLCSSPSSAVTPAAVVQSTLPPPPPDSITNVSLSDELEDLPPTVPLNVDNRSEDDESQSAGGDIDYEWERGYFLYNLAKKYSLKTINEDTQKRIQKHGKSLRLH